MAGPLITLTTDFGTSDSFVGTMKGIIYGINPDAVAVDITHEVPPQDVRAAAFIFDSAYHYFPAATIHVIVVDPTVGTSRRPIAVAGRPGTFVCPDNGVLSHVLGREGGPQRDREPTRPAQEQASAGAPSAMRVGLPEGWRAYHLTNHQYWHTPVSDTFHGRDIFAPVAAHLSRGVALASMGAPVRDVVALETAAPTEEDGVTVGAVMLVDRFGNLVTNIPAGRLFGAGADVMIRVADRHVRGVSRAYASRGPTGAQELMGIIGSHGYLEIAAPNASAASVLGVGRGAEVRV